MEMPIGERKNFLNLTVQEIERQNKEWEESLKMFQNL
jgi:hypothetical protein